MGQLTKNEIFALAVQRYSDTVFRAAMHNCSCTADAEDVVQDVFEKLLCYNGRFESEEHLKAWLLRVTINRPREHGEIKDCDINPLRNKRDVWKINTVPFKGGHYAAYPPKLVETCLLAGCPEGGIVLDPFMGSGTTGMVASQMGRHFVGVELNPEYTELAYKRIGGEI